MLAEYEIDTKLLGYWILGLTMVLTVTGLYLADFSPSQIFEDEHDLEVTVEDDVLGPNELTTLTVTENGEPVQGATIRADSLNIGETKRNGKLSFRALENDFTLNATYNNESATEEITVLTEEQQEEQEGEEDSDESEQQQEETGEGEASEDEDEETQDEEDETGDDSVEEDFTGIRLDSTLEEGEENRLTAYENGARLGLETVYFNGEEQGETSPGGTMTFTPIDINSLTIEVGEVEEQFDIDYTEEDEEQETVTGNIEADLETGGLNYVGETVTLDASETESQNQIESFNWNITHENETLERQTETTEFQPNYTGEYQINLDVKDVEGFADTESTIVDVNEEYEGPDIYLNEPWDGSQLGPGHLFEFSVTNARNTQQAQIIINEETVASTNLGDGTNIIEEDGEGGLFAEFPVEGTQDYTVKVEDLEQNWESEPMTVEIERPWNQYGTFSATEPEDGATVQTEEQENEEGETVHTVEFEFTFNLETDVELTVNGQEQTEQQEEDGEEVEEFSYTTTINQDTETYTAQIETEPGEYNWTSQIQPVNTDETPETTDQKQLTIQQ